MNPYETLGVKPTASAHDIRSAFRRKARDAHPDREGGSDSAMAAVNEAKAILLDPARRLHYDATGDTSPEEPADKQATQFLMQEFQRLLDDDEVNLVAAVASRIAAQHAEVLAQIPILRRRRVKLERRRAKVTVKSGVNLVHRLIDQQLCGIDNGLKACDKMVEIMTSAKLQLAQYECSEVIDPVRQDMVDAVAFAMSMLSSSRGKTFRA